jgi:hypothetical protein
MPAAGPPSASGPAAQTGAAAGAARRAGGGDADAGRRFDPDNPWEVAAGVDPVITAQPDTARHDPGPNVIGWRG